MKTAITGSGRGRRPSDQTYVDTSTTTTGYSRVSTDDVVRVSVYVMMRAMSARAHRMR